MWLVDFEEKDCYLRNYGYKTQPVIFIASRIKSKPGCCGFCNVTLKKYYRKIKQKKSKG